MNRILILCRALGRMPRAVLSPRKPRPSVLPVAAFVCALFIAAPTAFVATGNLSKQSAKPDPGTGGLPGGLVPYSSQAVAFAETRPLRELRIETLTAASMEKIKSGRSDGEKNEWPTRIKPEHDLKRAAPFSDPTLSNQEALTSAQLTTSVTNPIANFDGPDADAGEGLYGGRLIPPDASAAVGPNHVVAITNMGLRIYDKSGNPLTAQFRLSQLLVGIPNADRDDGVPMALYDSLADRWILSQFNLTLTANSTHHHIAVSRTADPTGAYYAYDFLLTPNRPGTDPKMGVWSDGYYMSTNDFSLPVFSNPFKGAGLYAFEKNKMLVGDPTAKIIGFNTNNQHADLLPGNLQGLTPPPIGTPELFGENDAQLFGAPTDLVRFFSFHVDFNTPANSTLTQGPDIPTAPFDAREPNSRADIQQPAPGEAVDAVANRLMYPLNVRMLPGGIQSYVLNFTVNVSGVNPTGPATYQAGVRWMELRRNPATGAVTINQEATYAPGSGNPTGRDLWVAGIAQDGEGNIGLAASATNSTSAILNPTAIYTGRLAGDPANTLPQGEVDAMSTLMKGVQIANSFNRWGTHSSLFVDPADDCTLWGAFEYADTPNAAFDWNTRIFSFKVNPICVTPPRGSIQGTITNCANGQPIPNAVITTPDGYHRQSNASGQFSMTVAPGTYTVTVSGPPATGFSSCTQTITVAANGTATVNCCLEAVPIIVSAGATIVSESCTPPNGVLDPNETVTVSFCVQNTGSLNTSNLVGTLQATGGVTSPSGPQNYGSVVTGAPPVCRDFTFTVAGSCGGTATASIQFQDGATSPGTLTYTFTLGTVNVTFSENFDGVTAPGLPAGWTASQGVNPTMAPLWVTSTTTPDTAPNDAFSPAPSNTLDNRLDSPSIVISSGLAQLTFRNNFNLQDSGGGFDGAVLEIASPNINGGLFSDITDAAVGGTFVQNGYNSTISSSFGSPIAGRMAWSGTSNGYVTTIANLGPNVAGQTIKLRFREATDNSAVGVGWRIDTIRITDGFACTCPVVPCVITCPVNITVSNDPNQCGAVVNYPAPTTTGPCVTIACSPASGSFFPRGSTTVTCTTQAGPSCTFTIAVNDTQPPTITCPPNITTSNATVNNMCVVANFNVTASDNCPIVTTVCTPASGSCFPVGTTTVTCTATDSSGNTATCSFTVSAFNVCLQNDSSPGTVFFGDSVTGAYRFCCGGTVFTGVAQVTKKGNITTFQHNASDRRVVATTDLSAFKGTASLQSPPGTSRCTIADKDTRNNSCVCQ